MFSTFLQAGDLRRNIEHYHPEWVQKRWEGGQGGGRPSNVLQDHFSNSSNSGVKIAGGG